MTALDLKIGDSIDVGMKTLRLARVLTYEPDRAGNFYSLTPRVLINLADLQATGVVQPGSRVTFRELWRGPASALATYRELVKPGLAANQRRDGNQQIGGALGKAERYLNMASLVAVLLSGVAVALSATRFAARRFDASALLRCLGLSRREAMTLFSLQLAILGLLASISGALLGWLAQLGLFQLLHDLLPADVPPGGLTPALAGIGTGLVAAAGRTGPGPTPAGTAPRPAADPGQHLDGLRHGPAGAWPDHVAPEPGPGADLRPARRRRDCCAGARWPVAAGPAKPAPAVGEGLAALAPGPWPIAAPSTGRRRPVPGLWPDPAVDGPDRAAARRTARYLAEPVAEKCTELLRPEYPARRQGWLSRSPEQTFRAVGADLSGSARPSDQHQRRSGAGHRQQGLCRRPGDPARPQPDLGRRPATGQYPDGRQLVVEPARPA